MMLLTLFTLIFLLVIILIGICRKKSGLSQFPEPPGVFLIGHALELRSTTNILFAFSKYIRKYGKTVKLRVGPITGLVTTDYKFTEFILNSNNNLKKSQNYLYLVPWLGQEGLLLSDGIKWKHNRKVLTPAFHFEILKQFVETFESVGDTLIQKMATFVNTPSLELYQLLNLCTLDAICETAMGTKINAQNGENIEYVNSVQRMCKLAIDRCLSPFKIFNSTFIWTKDYLIQRKVVRILQDFSTKVIHTRKEEVKSSTYLSNQKKKMALLDMLIKFSNEGKILSDEEIKDQVNTFMFAGHHTTSSGICFTLFCLANYTDVQQKVYEEQKQLCEKQKNPLVTYTNLQEMKYLELVIKETLRLYPPVPIVGRLTTKGIKFEDYVIPSNTNIAIYIYEIHRNPEYFPEPEKFIPERFENFDSSHPFCYIPFSAGSRNCIGMKYAMLEMKSIISKIVRNFELFPTDPKHELILAAETVLKSANGIRIRLKRRT